MKTLMTLDHTSSMYAALGRVESELVGYPGRVLIPYATSLLRFVVHAAGWLHSMVLHGRDADVNQCC